MEPLRIAVCEDSTEEQKKLLTILEQSEIKTETAIFANGEDFLRIYQLGKYDLLLMDIYMSGMTGVEVVTEIRKTEKSLYRKRRYWSCLRLHNLKKKTHHGCCLKRWERPVPAL